MTRARRCDSWPEEALKQAAKLWNDDCRSASEIGREMGRSRNSVIGIVHRNRELFRSRAPKQAATPKMTQAPTKAALQPVITTAPKPAIEKLFERLDEPLPVIALVDDRVEIVASRPVAFLLVTDRQCKWPLWSTSESPGPDGLCCGVRINFGDVYCRHHGLLSQGKGTRSEQLALDVLGRVAR